MAGQPNELTPEWEQFRRQNHYPENPWDWPVSVPNPTMPGSLLDQVRDWVKATSKKPKTSGGSQEDQGRMEVEAQASDGDKNTGEK